MKIYLAGYNVDATVLNEIKETVGKRDDLTPEVLSAAYARISRDPRPINEIRETARNEFEKARKSNSTIIFKMGHHSVAEHAVFNLDVLGVSRFAMEELEKFRLCSYTEKSQRYITLQDDFVIPEEIKNTANEELFKNTVKLQNEAYWKLFDQLKKHVFEKHADLASDPKKHNLLEGWAKEDARYITALATESQVGQTINARNLELLLRRFASHPLAEIKQLGKELYKQISDVAPSIILFYEANDRDLYTYPELKNQTHSLVEKISASPSNKAVELVEFTKDADNIIAATLLHASSGISYEQCRETVKQLSPEDKKNILKSTWKNMQFYDSMVREFEYANLTYNIVLSSACFGQLKRHRMSSISSQAYDPSLGVTIPDAIKEIGMDGYFQEIVDKTNDAYETIYKETPLAAPYILTNAHRKRILMRVNARELYHISRLREDAHAQWDVQNISRDMVALGKEVMPLTLGLIGGKDRYNDIYKELFGTLPKVKEAVLPGTKSTQ